TPIEQTLDKTIVLMPQYEKWETGFELSAGVHQLHLSMLQESVEIKNVEVKKVTELTSYEKYIAEQKAKHNGTDNGAVTIYTDAELLSEKSHLEVAVSYDRSSPNIYPSDPSRIRYNILGGSAWSRAGQWVSYKVNVEASGFYKLNIVYRQRTIAGVDVRRRVYIDGEVPFSELDCVLFPASRNFVSFTPKSGDNDCYIYLEKGEHEVKFEVVLDSLQNVIVDFEKTLVELNELSSKINVIVGEGVDLNRDYDFVSALPELKPTLEAAADSFEAIVTTISRNSTENGSQAARIEEAVRLFRKMALKPNDIAKQIDYFRTQLYDLASVLSTMQTQPIELDYFELIPEEDKTSVKKENFLSVVLFRVKAFLASFADDYSAMNNVGEGEETLNVWVSLGRDQAQIMNQLVTDNFTPSTGIPVKLSLVTTNIMTAIASGKAPQVVLNLGSSNIADLYYRDALVDISGMDNIDTILERFYPSALTSFKYNDALYALPQTQSFQMMFYRTDVFKANGFSAPETWDELYALLSKMQNNGMTMGISISEETFYMMLLQQGITLYNEDLSKTNLTDNRAVEAFGKWTSLFTKYGIPKSFDATNRFRTGQMPLVLNDYTFYRTLKVSAPEIQNSFAMAPLPGVKTENGIVRGSNTGVSGAVIIKSAGDDYKNAMKFIDWATSDETQEKYSFNSEIRVGISARVNTANKKVMSTISWSRSELEALNKQWEQVEQIPVSPAYYYISRNLNNAFRRVVYQYEKPIDVIYRYAHEIDTELDRKRVELNLGGEE
ncbi:MAG: extracellular solute-binding protein, partial [Clostridia bacterium]|nr:extracellular solute-binding protein [Clostridia bacterium]